MRHLALGLVALTPMSASAVVWERQAERLQKVSAALLDAVPLGEPAAGKLAFSLGVNISFLPKVNPTVGSKREKVPSSPVHTVPTLGFSSDGLKFGDFGLGLALWGGFLPSGGEKLFGIDAKLTQSLVGGQVVATYEGLGWTAFVPVGFQKTSAEMTGAITEEGADDTFSSDTSLFFIAPGVQIPALGVWANVLLGKRQNTSAFKIPSDDTDFTLRDGLGDADWPFVTQFTVGYRPWPSVQVTLSEQWTPARLLMPRLGVSYTYDFGSEAELPLPTTYESKTKSEPAAVIPETTPEPTPAATPTAEAEIPDEPPAYVPPGQSAPSEGGY